MSEEYKNIAGEVRKIVEKPVILYGKHVGYRRKMTISSDNNQYICTVPERLLPILKRGDSVTLQAIVEPSKLYKTTLFLNDPRNCRIVEQLPEAP